MSSRKRRDLGTAAMMLLPSLAILSAFVLYPLGRAVWMGQQRCSAVTKVCRSSGWGQYLDVLQSSQFQNALVVTVKFVLLTVPVGLFLGVVLAVLADKAIRGIGFFRTVFTSTIATSVAVASLMWLFLLQPSIGVLTNVPFLVKLFPVIKNPGLLQDSGTALSAAAASSVWANLGFTFVLVTAGLQSIPRDLYESAFVDGAGGFRRFTNVTLPMLSPVLLFSSVVLTSRAFQAYGEFDLLTGGGPKPQFSTTTVTYLAYGTGTSIGGDDGLKSTIAILLFVILLILSAAQFRGFGKRVEYGN